MTVTRSSRSFWWDAGRPASAATDPLHAVVFDLDGALAEHGLDDLVNSLYFAGVAVAVVSTGARSWVAPLARQLIGEGIAEIVVTPDDLPRPGYEPDLHGHALWELGIAPESALAVAGTPRGYRAARAAKLATVVVTTDHTVGADYAGAAEVRSSYDGLLASGCEVLHRRYWAGR